MHSLPRFAVNLSDKWRARRSQMDDSELLNPIFAYRMHSRVVVTSGLVRSGPMIEFRSHST